MSNQTDQCLAGHLQKTKTIALVGASANKERASYRVMDFLLSCGYQVYPVNPILAGQTILGQSVYETLADIPVSIDMVDVFRQSQYLYDIVIESAAIGAKLIWTQLGVTDESANQLSTQIDIAMIVDRCPAIEIPRLRELSLL